VGISSLRVLFSLWMGHYKCMRTWECVFKRKYTVYYEVFFVFAHTLPVILSIYCVYHVILSNSNSFFFFITMHTVTSSALQYRGTFCIVYSTLLQLPPPKVPLCWRMLGLNPGQLRILAWTAWRSYHSFSISSFSIYRCTFVCMH
jgi:hypothetical protein